MYTVKKKKSSLHCKKEKSKGYLKNWWKLFLPQSTLENVTSLWVSVTILFQITLCLLFLQSVYLKQLW